MRRAYQKAVTIPLNNVEHLWKEYDQWENNLNRLTAKKFLGEKSSAYMTARTALREMRLFTDNINSSAVSLPPQWSPSEINQLELWKKYIEWEKSDPLKLEDEAAIMERVSYTYQQAFLVLRLYPELWYSYASYYREHNKPEKALSILKQGIEILPTSLLLNFCYAELCESRKQLDDAKQAFDSLIENLDKEIEDLKQAAEKDISRLDHEADEERSSLKLSEDVDGELREQLRTKEKQVRKEQEEIRSKLNEQIEVLARASSLVWICYMRFARRTEGIRSARSLFSKARKATNCTYHVFVSSALMEYHNSKDASIAGKVFTLGHKLFADNPDFVCQYLDFLIQMNDDNNTRALFERTLATMPPEKAAPIWLKFLDYENKYGDLASVQSVEERRLAAVPAASPMESFLLKHSYLDINNINEYELGSVAREQNVTEVNTAIPTEIANHVNIMNERPPVKEHVKRPLLEPVHPERYPRPDFNQWQTYKPSAESNRRPPIPINNTSSPAIPPVVPSSDVTVAESTVATNVPLASVSQPLSWNNPLTQPLPDAVAYFVSNLPPAQTFNGPLIQPGELVDLLRNIIIPLPPQGGSLPPQQPIQQSMRGPISQQSNKNIPPMHSSRDMSPMRNNYGSNRGRGGFKARGNNNMPTRGGGGGKQNVKRRNRDDYDDDYQSHKGIGPNRPPDFDLFRQRQAKRHRDDPPY
ncbi:hypothetical protein BDB01DRAFT_844804 [Pilobolus umbonatus]|nr:hypothetical protein BDB01DRAFT_844804 [Pilobolus umbonatus]